MKIAGGQKESNSTTVDEQKIYMGCSITEPEFTTVDGQKL